MESSADRAFRSFNPTMTPEEARAYPTADDVGSRVEGGSDERGSSTPDTENQKTLETKQASEVMDILLLITRRSRMDFTTLHSSRAPLFRVPVLLSFGVPLYVRYSRTWSKVFLVFLVLSDFVWSFLLALRYRDIRYSGVLFFVECAINIPQVRRLITSFAASFQSNEL